MAESGPGLYGKLPTEADFVRWSAGEFSRAGLDRWFEEGNGALLAARARLPDEPVFFCLPSPADRAVFVGAFVASEDALGRSFPLIVFRRAAADHLGEDFWRVPGAYEEFLTAAAACLQSRRTLGTPDFLARVAALPEGSAADAWQDDVAVALSREPVTPLGAALGDLSRQGACAFRTFGSACAQTHKAPPASTQSQATTVTIDAPAPTGGVRALWLALAQRLRRADVTWPSFFWTLQSGRLLLALGPPPVAMLSYLASPHTKATRLWPLKSEMPALLDAAVRGNTAAQTRALADKNGSLNDLLIAFSDQRL